jgi:hypothetical protein
MFADRIALSGTSITEYGTNVRATRQSGEPRHAGSNGGKSVWWTWTAPASGSVTVDTIGSGFDTLLAVYTGTSVSALSTVASNNNASGAGRASKVTFTATAGRAYQIAVDGYKGASGSVVLHLAMPYVASASLATTSTTTSATDTSATRSSATLAAPLFSTKSIEPVRVAVLR